MDRLPHSILEHSLTPKRNPSPFSHHPNPHLSASPGQPIIYILVSMYFLLFLYICLFWAFHITRIIQWMAIIHYTMNYSFMASFSHIARISTLILLPNNIVWIYYIWFIHNSLDTWVVSTFWLQWIMFLFIVSFWLDICFLFSWSVPKSRMANSSETLMFTSLWNCQTVFENGCISLYLTSSVWGSSFFPSLPHVFSFDYSCPSGVKW